MQASSIGSPASQVSPKGYSRVDRNVDRIYLLFAAVWAFSSAELVGRIFNPQTSLLNRVSMISLLINWVIFPFKPYDGWFDHSMQKREVIARIASFSINLILGIFTYEILIHFISPFNKEVSLPWVRIYFLFETIVLIASNCLSCYGLQNRPFSSVKIDTLTVTKAIGGQALRLKDKIHDRALSIVRYVREPRRSRLVDTSVGYGSLQDQKTLNQEIRQQIQAASTQNQELEEGIERFRQFIENHAVLFQAFQASVKETKEILLDPPMQDDSTPVNEPLAEEWRQANLKHHHLLALKTRFIDFLGKNPEFQRVLVSELNQQNIQIPQFILT